jgi:hypothetical protein
VLFPDETKKTPLSQLTGPPFRDRAPGWKTGRSFEPGFRPAEIKQKDAAMTAAGGVFDKPVLPSEAPSARFHYT